MRETRQSGSEGGARFNPCPYPYSCGQRFAKLTSFLIGVCIRQPEALAVGFQDCWRLNR